MSTFELIYFDCNIDTIKNEEIYASFIKTQASEENILKTINPSEL